MESSHTSLSPLCSCLLPMVAGERDGVWGLALPAAAESTLAGGAGGSRGCRWRGLAPLLARVTERLPRRQRPSASSIPPSSALPASEGDSPPTSMFKRCLLPPSRATVSGEKTAPLAHINICTHKRWESKEQKKKKLSKIRSRDVASQFSSQLRR